MAFSTQYKELFKVEILHLYFLNKGVTPFNIMSEPEKEKQLDLYDYQNFMQVQPTLETLGLINGHQMVFNSHKSGFSVWVKVADDDDRTPAVQLDDDLILTFTLKIKDYRFFNFTEIDNDIVGKTLYFSNRRPTTEPNSFPHINQFGDGSKIDNSFILSDDGVDSVTTRMLSGEKSNLFGIVALSMKADTNTLDITTTDGTIPEIPKKLELYFENRQTFWRYIFQINQTVAPADDVIVENSDKRVLVTKNKYPLVQRGFVEVRLNEVELPNPDAHQIKPDVSSNKIYSEIYM